MMRGEWMIHHIAGALSVIGLIVLFDKLITQLKEAPTELAAIKAGFLLLFFAVMAIAFFTAFSPKERQ